MRSLWLFLAACGVLAAQTTPVILISIDTLRADHVGVYGYRRVPTANIDSYAAGGTVVEQADAQIPLTLPSHASLFTSTYPFQNGIEENAEPLKDGPPSLASVLKGRGYQTAAFAGSVFLEKEMGLDAGFDFYDSPFRFTAFSPLSGSMFFGAAPRGVREGAERRDGALVVRAATQWLSARRGQSVFAFVHLYDLHTPYRHSATHALTASPEGYDRELQYVDRLLGRFKSALVEQGWWDRSLVIVLSDHGESLGDHGEGTHGYFIYESTLRVPLLIHWPSGFQSPGTRIAGPAGLIDVAPTVLDFLRIPAPSSFAGTSLLRTPPAAVFGESFHCHDSFGWSPLLSLRVGEFKYIQAPRPELYNLKEDPGETRNLVRTNPAKAASLRTSLGRLLSARGGKRSEPAAQTAGTRALLGSLGYLAAGPGLKRGTPGADPKDKLPEFRLYEDAMAALYNRNLEKAASILRRLVAMDPGNTLARRDLGSVYLEQKHYSDAAAAFRKVLEAAPGDYVTNYELGIAAARLGRKAEAEERLRTACRIAPAAEQCGQELKALSGQR